MFYFVGRFSRPILPNAHCDWSVGLFTYKIVKMESEWTDDAVMCLINTAVKRHSHFSQMAQCWILPAVAMQLVYHGIQDFVDSKVLFRRT